MLQSFDPPAQNHHTAARLSALRTLLHEQRLNGFFIPRADCHQGEYVAPRDERLQWVTGFSGSAGFAIVLADCVGLFVDGRYRVQVKTQVDLTHITPVNWPETGAADWLAQHVGAGVIGFDPWLHTAHEIDKITAELKAINSPVTLRPLGHNLIDALWSDQPAPPQGAAFAYPETLAGESSTQKRARLGDTLQAAGHDVAVLTLPDSICWLLNLRGADVARSPLLHGFALLFADGRTQLFVDIAKFDEPLQASLSAQNVTLHPPQGFVPALSALRGTVRLDVASAPYAIRALLQEVSGVNIVPSDDPCRLPKACKNPCEIAAIRTAHRRDGVAMVEFLAWFFNNDPSGLSEIDIVSALEQKRHASGALHDLSFDTICGAGPNGAIIHYRVTTHSNRLLRGGDVLLIDSGAQYLDGTTDVTRTLSVPPETPSAPAIHDIDEIRACYTRVLRGLINLSKQRFPKGVAGRDLDALARAALWQAGQDYPHGTGHGVGMFLSVHEGPQRLSRLSDVPLRPGMILSNEPGYYREGAFGIRLENLICVIETPPLGDGAATYGFETLTLVPFDTALIDTNHLTRDEVDWLNAYHRTVYEQLHDQLSPQAQTWLTRACAPLNRP